MGSGPIAAPAVRAGINERSGPPEVDPLLFALGGQGGDALALGGEFGVFAFGAFGLAAGAGDDVGRGLVDKLGGCPAGAGAGGCRREVGWWHVQRTQLRARG